MSEENTNVKVELSVEDFAEQAGSRIESALAKARSTDAKYHGASLFDSINDSQEKIVQLINDSSVVDHFGNSLSASGTDDKVEGFNTYGFSADTLQWPLWLALYNDSWVFKRAIDKPAQDMISSGFTLRGSRNYDVIYKAYNKYKTQLQELLKWGALFGGAIAVILFENVENKDLDKPLNPSSIKGKRFKLYVTDRWYGVSPSTDDLVKNMKNIDFGKPKYYQVVLSDGTEWKVHHSYILRYEHRTAPNLIKNGYLQGWGYAEGSHIINELARDDQLKSSITSLVNKALIEVIKMSGMRGVFMGTDKGNEVQLRKRLEMVNWGRTYNSLTFLDKDDEYQQYQLTGLTGLAELLEKNMWMISSALEMQGILFGDLKGGLSQESDAFARYSQTIYNRCDTFYRNILYKFLDILFYVYDIKDEKGVHETPDFDFEYLDKFERNKAKVTAISEVANVMSKLEQDGVISKYQYAKTIKDYINGDNLNIAFTDEILNKLKLEEEQAILDTIKELGKKRNRKLNYTREGNLDIYNPFSDEPIEEDEENFNVETQSTVNQSLPNQAKEQAQEVESQVNEGES